MSLKLGSAKGEEPRELLRFVALLWASVYIVFSLGALPRRSPSSMCAGWERRGYVSRLPQWPPGPEGGTEDVSLLHRVRGHRTQSHQPPALRQWVRTCELRGNSKYKSRLLLHSGLYCSWFLVNKGSLRKDLFGFVYHKRLLGKIFISGNRFVFCMDIVKTSQ